MAHALHPTAQDRKRVKVYELKNNDWYDRGTGFCHGSIVALPQVPTEPPDVRIVVLSEDDPQRTLLETCITKNNAYQKQQDTLIVWTETTGVDMALSFQEADGCTAIWEFVSDAQNRSAAAAAAATAAQQDDGLSDDLLETPHQMGLPEPQLGRLDEVEHAIRAAASTPPSREALIKFIMSPEQMYILKLTPLVTMAEDLESVADLHRLCTIMKHLILLNDTAIIEFAVTDAAIMGVVGALEYDPDFPSHRANHRQYLSDSSKFKEVVKIEQEDIRRKIHYTYRLLYLKDVVLARILDDPTFSVLNSLIFFHQVDIVNHLQSDPDFLGKLFAIFSAGEEDGARKKDAVLFIQNCCAVAKNIQAQSRAHLYQKFINYGLFSIITFALRHQDASVRVAGTDILVAMIDHDAHMVRTHIFGSIKEKATPLTDTLIELLLAEVDLGVKSQMADAIKILLDPNSNSPMEMVNRQADSEMLAKQRAAAASGQNHIAPQTEAFIQSFYDDSAKRLFAPLLDLEHKPSMSNLSVHQTSLFTHLVEILCFFVRQHSYKSKLFILERNLHNRIAQLLRCPQKHMKLTALKWFRTCMTLQDEFHNRHIIQHELLEPILEIVEATMPRDNLLNSACLEFFEFIKRETIKQLIMHLAERYRDRLMAITYVNTFQALVLKYDQMQGVYGAPNGAEDSSFTTQEGTPRVVNGGQRYSGLKEMDSEEEAYFNADDDDDEDGGLPTMTNAKDILLSNGASPLRPLVNYPMDDDEDAMDILASPLRGGKSSSDDSEPSAVSTEFDPEVPEMDQYVKTPDRYKEEEEHHERGRNRRPVPLESSPGYRQSPPEPLAAKRRREEEEEDDLGMTVAGIKRRNSSASSTSQPGRSAVKLEQGQPTPVANGVHRDESGAPTININIHQDQHQQAQVHGHGHMLRRKGSLKTKNETVAGTAHGHTPQQFVIKPLQAAAQNAAAAKREREVDEDERLVDDGEDGGGNG